jgi:hypothetical protein
MTSPRSSSTSGSMSRVVDHGEAAEWPGVQPRYADPALRGEGAPEMTDPGGESAATAGGHGRLRASRADRERVIELLKVAFIEDRLTQDELDTRVGLALASRIYADLAELTADISYGSAAAERAVEPAGTPARTLAKAARRSGTCMLVAFALVGAVALTNAASLLPPAILLGIAAVMAASGFLGYGVVDAWQERRSHRQLLPRLGPSRHALGGEQRGGADDDPIPPGPRTRPGPRQSAV